MRAYNNREARTRSCGYCRHPDHAIRDCPNVEYDAKEWAAFRVPIKSPTLNHCRWYRSDYSYWIKAVNKYYPKFVAARERKANPSTTTRRASPRKCGFCGEASHTRRTCQTYAQFAKDLKQANANYRQALYNHLVKNLGLGIGAAVKVSGQDSSGHSAPRKEAIGVINGFDLDNINLFASSRSTPRDYKGTFSFTVLVDGQTRNLTFKSEDVTDCAKREVFPSDTGWYTYAQFEQALGASTQPLDEEWVNNGCTNEFDWLLKKRSLEWLKEHRLYQCVEKWK